MYRSFFGDFKFIVIVAYYFSAITFTLPIKLRRNSMPHSHGEFRVSLVKALLLQGALISIGAFIYCSSVHLLNCHQTSDCSESYVVLLEASYAFSLLLVTLFILSPSLAKILNILVKTCHDLRFRGTKKSLGLFLVKAFLFYVVICVEIIRKQSNTYELINMTGIFSGLSWYYSKLVIYAFDNLTLSSFLVLELKFYILNQNLMRTTSIRKVLQNRLLSDHWYTVAILRQTSKCLGPLLLTTLIYKQLHIVGMIYFTLLANLPDDGNDVFQILDLTLPTLILTLICFQASKIISECKRFPYLLQNLSIEHSEFDSANDKEMVISYPRLLKIRHIFITASDFMVIRAGLILKIALVASTSIISIVQLNPLPPNITLEG